MTFIDFNVSSDLGEKMRFYLAIVILILTTTTALALDFQSTLADAWKYYNNSNYTSAAKTFAAAAKNDPSSAEAYRGLGLSYMNLGYSESSTDLEMVEKAARAFETALQLNANMPDVRYKLGIAYLCLDDKQRAAEQCRELSLTDPTLSKELSGKIGAYKKQESYSYLYNEHNLSDDRRQAALALERKKIEIEVRRQKALEAAQAAELEEKKRLRHALERAGERASSAEEEARDAEERASRAEAEAEHAVSESRRLKMRIDSRDW